MLINEILPKITKKTKEKDISSTLESWNTCMVSFDLWMSRAGVDTFVLIMHFLNDKWEPCHVTIGSFEKGETSRGMPWFCKSMKSLQNMGSMFGLLHMSKMRGVIFQPWPLHWLLLYHVRYWGWQHHLWGHGGGMPCLSVANMLSMILKFVLV